ncbi:hypothetical protein DFQ27_009627 [Actinomortierella ambigua]|uniref:Methyltransferase domain-containing protein n=1 Tax=Actinomortierella ambigua TaxID=1343610 RepID=A0A9P6QHB0_9FUNG|nr:hypothetical protein DFQ27_009627 [Actinomortierella ambigua]
MTISAAAAVYAVNQLATQTSSTSRWLFLIALVAGVYLTGVLDCLRVPMVFMINNFLKPLRNTSGESLETRLESYYSGQAGIYDTTRNYLLRGRASMLALMAAQLKEQAKTLPAGKKPIWIDLGGGTGWNIEQMQKYYPLENFERIYLVDLCSALCNVARQRVEKQGWTNVEVICEDATKFTLPGVENDVGKVDAITMSYSLSMMEGYYAIVDRVQEWLHPELGLFGIVDFYTAKAGAKVKTEGMEDYHCNWLTRTFWRAWFEVDHVHLGSGRRDYVEFKFQSRMSLNLRNHFIVPYLIQIPYYIYIGERHKDHHSRQQHGFQHSSLLAKKTSPAAAARKESTERLHPLDLASLTPRSMSVDSTASGDTSSVPDSPTSTSSAQTLITSAVAAKLLSLPPRSGDKSKDMISEWRVAYNPTLDWHTQFRSYIYAFTWEDPRIDLSVLNLTKDDTMFVITSAGDNALEYALKGQPARIHCVDMNPCQNHLLELKLAAISHLDYTDFWQMFGEGQHGGFFRLLLDRLSPYMSSAAVQFWYKNKANFHSNFYETGYSGLALVVYKWLIAARGLQPAMDEMSTTNSIESQRRLWEETIKPATMPAWLVNWVLSHPAFLWNALGVPINQMKMILDEGSALDYIYDTLDPVMTRSLFKDDQYFYNLVINRRYTPTSCPSYLTEQGFNELKQEGRLDSFKLHTDSILNVLRSLKDGELTKAVLMDHMDWFNYKDAEEEIREVARVIRRGGMVLWRSAGRMPWYNALFEKHGFDVQPVDVRVPRSGVSIDRVNMYASCYRAIRK